MEYLVPPADKDAYFGEADYLEMLADDYQSTDMMWTLAADNLEVTADVEVLRVHPVELSASDDTTAVESRSRRTPAHPHHHSRSGPAGRWHLERQEEGTWEPAISPSRATTTAGG